MSELSDINFFRGLSTVFTMAAFLGVCFWAYSKKRKADFDSAAQLPFADDELDETLSEPTTGGRGDE